MHVYFYAVYMSFVNTNYIIEIIQIPPITTQGYHIFMLVAKRISYEHSPETVMNAFNALCGSKSFEIFSAQLPPDLKSLKACNVARY